MTRGGGGRGKVCFRKKKKTWVGAFGPGKSAPRGSLSKSMYLKQSAPLFPTSGSQPGSISPRFHSKKVGASCVARLSQTPFWRDGLFGKRWSKDDDMMFLFEMFGAYSSIQPARRPTPDQDWEESPRRPANPPPLSDGTGWAVVGHDDSGPCRLGRGRGPPPLAAAAAVAGCGLLGTRPEHRGPSVQDGPPPVPDVHHSFLPT